jgi:hypothetical protein
MCSYLSFLAMHRTRPVWLFIVCICVSYASTLSNSVTVTEVTGSTQTARPISIARLFTEGEIAGYPQPSISGSPLSVWQSDVKNRWPDGSVRFALISFTQTISGNASAAVSFVNNVNPCSSGNAAACTAASLTTAAAMLAPSWMTGSPPWNAQIELTNGTTKTINARTLLGTLAFDSTYKLRYWMQGPVVTQVFVEDRSSARSQDVGWDANNSLHPWFVLTFYNGFAGVKVEYIVENMWTTTLQDLSYAINLKTAFNGTSLASVFTKPNPCVVTGASNATPIVITCSAAHGMVSAAPGTTTGQFQLTVSGVGGNTAANGSFYINTRGYAANQFALYTDSAMITSPASGNGAYTSGGTAAWVHIARTRWHKTFWAGTTPGPVKIDYNLPYLIASKALPNYDVSKVISAGAITQANTDFNASDQGTIMGNGQYAGAFGTTGGRPELGYLETWAVQYLYTFDPNLYAALMGNSDVSGHVPIHFREALAGRFFDDRGTIDAFGRVISIDARPTIVTSVADYANAGDKINPVGAVRCRQEWRLGCTTTWDSTAANPFTPDLAHQAAFSYLPYLITGEYYWLEEMQFWSAFNVGASGYGPGIYGRYGSFGIMHEGSVQGRGMVWAMRNLAHVSWMSPDGTPEKAYFLQKLSYNLASKEGQYNITTGSFYDTGTASAWSAGQVAFGGNVANPLKYPFYGDQTQGGYTSTEEDGGKIFRDTNPWYNSMWMVILGRMAEMGYPTDKLKEHVAKHIIHMTLDPAFTPWAVGGFTYGQFTTDVGHPYFSTWAAVLAGFTSSYLSVIKATWPNDVAGANDPNFGYVVMAFAASSYLPPYSDGTLTGQAARSWMERNISIGTADLISRMNDNPKWAILPRQTSQPLPSRCDLNGDGRVDIIDVQAAISQAAATQVCTTADLNGDGRCDVIDVQLVIIAAMGGTCTQ